MYIYIYICFGILGKFCYLAFISYIFEVLRFSRYKVTLSLFHLVDVVNPFKYNVKEKEVNVKLLFIVLHDYVCLYPAVS